VGTWHSIFGWTVCLWRDLDPVKGFGPRFHVDVSNYKPVETLGSLHMLPKPTASITGRCRLWSVTEPLNGMVWAPAYEQISTGGANLTLLSARIIGVPEKRVFDAADLTHTEKQLYAAAQCVDQSSGSVQLMKAELVMALLGLQDTPLPEALCLAFPCFQYILAATGCGVDACELRGEKCGVSRWCSACEECLRQTFRAPHAGMLTDHVSAWLGNPD